MLDLRGAWTSTDSIVELARLRSSNGDDLRVESLHVGEQMRVRLVSQINGEARLSNWTEVSAGTMQLAVGLAESGDQRMLLLVGGSEDLQLQLSDGAASLQVWGPPITGK